ncbi:MAG TPA: hypothetical protein VEZ20_06910 [Allosphingosinicella sp.]|nr:hypothetical protein [Allosphingosinicella sp.]
MRKIGFGAFACAALALPAAAAAAQADPPQRELRVTVYGDEPCPAAESPDEIVVCGRLPEEERYRIPRSLRDRGERRPGGTAWGARAEDLEEAQRDTRPNGCSVVGTNGQTGCSAALARQWYRDRRARRDSRGR